MSNPSNTGKNFLPYGRQWIDEDDIEAVAQVLRSDFLTTGPKVTEFENSIKKHLDVKHVVACSSGTAALHCALMAMGVGEGDAVIVPAITFVATANAVKMCGADVVFADVDAHSGMMEVEHFAHALKRAKGNVKAVIPVHLTGQCPNMAEISIYAKEHDILVLSDACHSLGANYSADNSAVGNCELEEMTCLSFHPVKTIAMGEGGAIATNNDAYASLLRSFVSHGVWQKGEEVVNDDMAFDSEGHINPWYHEFHRLGYNYRASDIHCALGISQMKKLPSFIEQRRALANRYKENIADLLDIVSPIKENNQCKSAWHLFPLLIDFSKLKTDKAALMHSLKDLGVGTQVHYIPVHKQPFYGAESEGLNLSGAEKYYESTLSFPLYPHMQLEDVDYVVTSLKSLLH